MSTGPDVTSDRRRIQAEQQRQGFDQDTMVLTSRDELAGTLMNALSAAGLARGFDGQLIPIDFGSAIETIVQASAGTTTEPHSHDTDGFHLILRGRVRVRVPDQNVQVELGPGEWVWIPTGVEYIIEILTDLVIWCYKHIPPRPQPA